MAKIPERPRPTLADRAGNAVRSVGRVAPRPFFPELRLSWGQEAMSDPLTRTFLMSTGVGVLVFAGAGMAWAARTIADVMTGRWIPSGPIDVLMRWPASVYWVAGLGGLAVAGFS